MKEDLNILIFEKIERMLKKLEEPYGLFRNKENYVKLIRRIEDEEKRYNPAKTSKDFGL